MDKTRLLQIAIPIGILIISAGCAPVIQTEVIPESTQTLPIPTPTEFAQQLNPTHEIIDPPGIQLLLELGLTYQQLDGNRFVPGNGNLPEQKPVDINLPGIPIWVVATPHPDGAIWYVTLQNGDIAAYLSSPGGVTKVLSQPSQLPPGMPPLLRTTADDSSLVLVANDAQSQISHPILLLQSSLRAAILSNGDLEFIGNSDELLSTLPVNALPDARLLVDERERILLLSGPTNRYNHGVLGDQLEAASITLIDTLPTPRITSVISLPENEVVEGIAPIWVDLTGNGQREIIVTVSDQNLGAGIVVFSESGDRLAEGPKMGRPFRWRHQIAVGPFAPKSKQELVVVRTPHIGGVIEYYRYNDGELEEVTQLPGITSHVIGSRNLDMAAAGDFDGDGAVELLVLNPSLSELIAVRRTSGGAEIVWKIPLDSRINTNLAAATLPNGDIVLGAGRSDGVLRLWLP